VQDYPFPHGRILIQETLRRHNAVGVYHKVTSSWFERSSDNAINQCVKYAIWYLAQRYKSRKPEKGDIARLSRLNIAFRLFSDVKLDLSRRFLNDPLVANPEQLPSTRDYYRQIIYLATTIINQRGVRFGGDNREIRIASLLVNMEALFESYLRSSLATNLAQIDSNIWVLDGNNKGIGGALKPFFDQEYPDDIARATEAKPDIVCSYRSPKDGMTSNALVIDVKYKVVKKVSARSDLEQAITYGLSYRSDIILLVHPRTNERHGLYPQGHIGKLEVYQYIFDLSADSLADEEILFAQRIYELIQAGTG
jgi:5-methylcytosine-specific restriction enzyme subunit McrC